MLDARWPLAHGAPAYGQVQYRRAAYRRAPHTTQENQKSSLPHALHRSGTEKNLRRAVRLSRRHGLSRTWRRKTRGIRFSAPPENREKCRLARRRRNPRLPPENHYAFRLQRKRIRAGRHHRWPRSHLRRHRALARPPRRLRAGPRRRVTPTRPTKRANLIYNRLPDRESRLK